MKNEIKEYIVAQEEHKDGHLHIHCYLELDKKINVKNANKFDIKDTNDVSYHGNY